VAIKRLIQRKLDEQQKKMESYNASAEEKRERIAQTQKQLRRLAKEYKKEMRRKMEEQRLIEEIERSIQALKETERPREVIKRFVTETEDSEDDEIQVDRGGERFERLHNDEDQRQRFIEDDREYVEEEYEREDEEYNYRPKRINESDSSRALSLLSSSLEDEYDYDTSSVASMMTQWLSGIWQWPSLPSTSSLTLSAPSSTTAVLLCAVLSFVASFFFLYLRKDVLSRIPNIFGSLKELLSLAFNIDRSVTGSAMMRRRRLQR